MFEKLVIKLVSRASIVWLGYTFHDSWTEKELMQMLQNVDIDDVYNIKWWKWRRT